MSRGASSRGKREKGPLAHLLRFSWFWMRFSWRYGVVPLFRVPRADVYYVHSYEYLPVPLVTGRNARVIYDAHDFYRDMYPQEMLSELVSRYLLPSLARLETAMARRCDAVVTVSQGVAEAIEEAMSVRPHVIPNAFDRRMNTQTSCDIRAQIGLAPDQILLVIAGNNKSETRFDYITAMLTALPTHVHIAFVGRGYEASDENMRQSDMRDRLHFIPAVPPFEITSFIASADAGLLLYRPISITFKNSLPNRFFHFLDAGLPIARFALPEVERVIGGAPVGPVLDPLDPIQAARDPCGFSCRCRCAARSRCRSKGARRDNYVGRAGTRSADNYRTAGEREFMTGAFAGRNALVGGGFVGELARPIWSEPDANRLSSATLLSTGVSRPSCAARGW